MYFCNCLFYIWPWPLFPSFFLPLPIHSRGSQCLKSTYQVRLTVKNVAPSLIDRVPAWLWEVRRANEPLKKQYFNFGGLWCEKNTLKDPSWAHIWNQRCMNFPKITLKTKFPSQMLSQSPKESLPPIWPRFWWHILQLDFLIFSSTVFLGRFQTGLNSSVMISNWSRMV